MINFLAEPSNESPSWIEDYRMSLSDVSEKQLLPYRYAGDLFQINSCVHDLRVKEFGAKI